MDMALAQYLMFSNNTWTKKNQGRIQQDSIQIGQVKIQRQLTILFKVTSLYMLHHNKVKLLDRQFNVISLYTLIWVSYKLAALHFIPNLAIQLVSLKSTAHQLAVDTKS